ncbi:HET-domain-containing protein [Xylariaceae sp. AK1471]|nr:HET-domain-containing protein [Xylariaceae sp. AK1471]
MTLFDYESLDTTDRQIRLLVLLPDAGPVRCHLRHVSLTKIQDEYETLSYCWGVPTTRRAKILVNGLVFFVTLNLYAALLRLRRLNTGEHDFLTAFAFKAVEFMASRWQKGGKCNYYDWKQVQRGEKSDGLQRQVVLPPHVVVVCAQGISKTNFEHQDAINPRDKIYGLMGIEYMHDDKVLINVDYAADVSQIFADFTRTYLERTGNLQVLAICRGCKSSKVFDSIL